MAKTTVKRPDLRVTAGTMGLDGAGKVTGRFVVANGGNAGAKRSTVALIVGTGTGRVVARRIVVPPLARGKSKAYTITVALPSRRPAGVLLLRVCADSNHRQRERSEANNCRRVGTTATRSAPAGTTTGTGTTTTPPATSTTPASPWVAPRPVAYTADRPFTIADSEGEYWVNVPSSYDATPTTLLLWLHGCGGKSEIDAPIVSKAGSRHYISVLPSGREGDCWDDADTTKALAALADVQQHFNIDPRHVVIAGFSSGGDLAYRTAFANAGLFAGVLGVNCQPFADEGASSIAAASWKFHVVQLAHTEDEAYNIADVRRKTDALAAAGFPVQRVERPGHHWDGDVNGVGGTINDYLTYLLPHLDDGWRAP
ncbi:MAG TPA: CARDB domain-containing protein [Baekduia sp.]|nr:CARDB domain-containing protein [Baekduia sp.]